MVDIPSSPSGSGGTTGNLTPTQATTDLVKGISSVIVTGGNDITKVIKTAINGGSTPLEQQQEFEKFLTQAIGTNFQLAFGTSALPDQTTTLNNLINDNQRPDANPPPPVEEWQCRVGGSLFFVPPINIAVNQTFEAGSMTGAAIRQVSSPKFNSGHSETTITMTLYFPGVDQIWGYQGGNININFDTAPDNEIDTFLASLRGLITQFRYTPFVPIVNTYLNEVWNINSVGFRGLNISTVKGFPYLIKAQLEMVNFNHQVYLPMVATLDDAIDWGRFRQFTGRAAVQMDKQANQAFVLDNSNVVGPFANRTSPTQGATIYQSPIPGSPGDLDATGAQIDVTGTDNTLNTSITADIQTASGASALQFFYPTHDPAEYTGPSDAIATYGFSDSSSTSTSLDESAWQNILDLYGLGDPANGFVPLNGVALPTLNQIQALAGGSLSAEFKFIQKFISTLGNVVNAITDSSAYNKAKTSWFKQLQAQNPGVSYASGSSAYEVELQAFEGQWYYYIYSQLTSTNNFLTELFAIQDYLRGTVEIDEWDVPMVPLAIDNSKFIVENLSVTMGNNLARLQLHMLDQPAYQHIGGLDTMINIDVMVLGEANLTLIRNMFDTINSLSRLEHSHAVLGFLGIRNLIVALAGTRYVIPKSYDVNTIPGYPHVYQVNLKFLDFDVFQQKREILSTAQEQQFVTVMSKRNPFLRIQQVWSALSAYSDFPLAVLDAEGNVAGYLDPDYYFKSFKTIDDDVIDNYASAPAYASSTTNTPTANGSQTSQNSDYPVVWHFGPISLNNNHQSIGITGAGGLDLRSGNTIQTQGATFNEAMAVNTQVKPTVTNGANGYQATPPSGYAFANFDLNTTGSANSQSTNTGNSANGNGSIAPYANSGTGTSVGNFQGMLADLQYRNQSGRMIRAFPTYMLWFIDEGGMFAGIQLFSDFYGLQSVIDFSVVSNQDVIGDTLILRLSNLYSRLSTDYQDLVDPSLFPEYATILNNTLNIARNLATGLDPNAVVNIPTINLQPGARLHLRVGYGCVDTETEILTIDGWKKYTDVSEGTLILTLNHETGFSEWQPIQKMNIYEVNEEEMYYIDSKKHSSLTTANHKWPVLHAQDGMYDWKRSWKESQTLKTNDKLILSAPNIEIPTEIKYTDEFVELVSWFWTEGNYGNKDKITGLETKKRFVINQYHTVNLENVESIRRALTVLYGPAVENLGTGSRWPRPGLKPMWTEKNRGKKGTEFRLNIAAAEPFRDICLWPDKYVPIEFIKSLTRSQLELFIDTAFKGDRNYQTSRIEGMISQSVNSRLDAMEYAAILLGYKTHRYWSESSKRFSLNIARSKTLAFSEKSTRPQKVKYSGIVWCPTTHNSTWMARRNGHSYFTGNSNPNMLDTVFNGVVTEVQQGDILVITAQSDAIELSAMVNSTNPSGSSGSIDGSLLSGFYLSEPRDLMVRLLSMGNSNWEEFISYATRGMIFSQSKFGIRHFGNILYDTVSDREKGLAQGFTETLGSITNVTDQWVNDNQDIAGGGAGSGILNPNIAGIAMQLWTNLNSTRDYEIYKRNIYPGNGLGIAQYMGGDIGDGGIATAFIPPGVNDQGVQTAPTPTDLQQLQDASNAANGKVKQVPANGPSIGDTNLVPGWAQTVLNGGAFLATGGQSGLIQSIGAVVDNTINLHPIWTALGLTPTVTDDVPGKKIPILGTYGPYAEISFRAETYQRTVWDLFQTCAKLLPNYIVAVRPWMERSTVFYGKPHWAWTSGVIPITYGVDATSTTPAISPIDTSIQNQINTIFGIQGAAKSQGSTPLDIYNKIQDVLSSTANAGKSNTTTSGSTATKAGDSPQTVNGDPNSVSSKSTATNSGSTFEITTLPLTDPQTFATIPARSGEFGLEMHLPTSNELSTDIVQHLQLASLPYQLQHPYYMDRGTGGSDNYNNPTSEQQVLTQTELNGQNASAAGKPGAFGYLDPADEQYYMNMRWDKHAPGASYPSSWAGTKILVFNPDTKLGCICTPGDWGPAENTYRVSGISPDTLIALGSPPENTVLWYGFVDATSTLGPVTWQTGYTFNGKQLPTTPNPTNITLLDAGRDNTGNLTPNTGNVGNIVPAGGTGAVTSVAPQQIPAGLMDIVGGKGSTTTVLDLARTVYGAYRSDLDAITIYEDFLQFIAKYSQVSSIGASNPLYQIFTGQKTYSSITNDAGYTGQSDATFVSVVQEFGSWVESNPYTIGWVVLTADVNTNLTTDITSGVGDVAGLPFAVTDLAAGTLNDLLGGTSSSILGHIANFNPIEGTLNDVASWFSGSGSGHAPAGYSMSMVEELFAEWITYGSGADTGLSTDEFNTSGGATEWMLANANPGLDSTSYVGQAIEGFTKQVTDSIRSLIGTVVQLGETVFSSIISILRFSMALLNQGISMSGFSGQQANLLSAVLNDSYYYDPALGVGSILWQIDNAFTRQYGEPVIEIREPFQRVHYINSFQHILANGLIETMNNVSTVVTASANGKSPHTAWFDKGAPPQFQYEKVVDTGLYLDSPTWYNWVLHPSEVIRDFVKHMNNSDDGTEASRFARAELAKSLKGIYAGEIMILGDSNIRPFDLLYISDSYERIYGLCEVAQVVHHFTPEMGFVTAITPAAIVNVNDPEKWSAGSILQRQLAVQDLRNYMRTTLHVTTASNPTNQTSIDRNQLINQAEANLVGSTQFSGGASAIVKDLGGSGVLGSLGGVSGATGVGGVIEGVGGFAGVGGATGVAAAVGGPAALLALGAAGFLGWEAFDWVRNNLLDAHGCFPAGVEILTSAGYKFIEDITTGDKVFTHKNRYRNVTGIMKRYIHEPVFELSFDRLSATKLTPTKEHPFLVFRELDVKRYKNGKIKQQDELNLLEPQWVEAKDLNKGDYVVIQGANNENSHIPTYDLADYIGPWGFFITDDYIQTKTNQSKKIPRHIFINENIMYIIGRYLGDGHIEYENNKIGHGTPRLIGFTYNKKEISDIDKICKLFESEFNIQPNKTTQSTNNGTFNLEFGSTAIASWVMAEFGTGSANKTIPNWVFTLPRYLKIQLLAGLFGSDGCDILGNKTSFKLDLTNKHLIMDVFRLFRDLGAYPTFSGGKIQKTNYGTGSAPHYITVATAMDSPEFSEAMNYSKEEKRERNRGFIKTNEFVAYRINNIKKIPFEGFVYNFAVEEDESYVVENVVSHNCYINYLNRNGSPMDAGLSYNQGVAVGQLHTYTLLGDSLGINIPYSIDGQTSITTSTLLQNLGWQESDTSSLQTDLTMWAAQTRSQIAGVYNTNPTNAPDNTTVYTAQVQVTGVIDPITLAITVDRLSAEGANPLINYSKLRLQYLVDPSTTSGGTTLALINPLTIGAATTYLNTLFVNGPNASVNQQCYIRVSTTQVTDPNDPSCLLGVLFYNVAPSDIAVPNSDLTAADLQTNRLTTLADWAGGSPTIGWQDFETNGTPYTLNWEMVINGYATVSVNQNYYELSGGTTIINNPNG